MPGYRVSRQEQNGTPSAAIAKDTLRKTGVLLALVGKPFYFFFAALIVGFFLLSGLIGKAILSMIKGVKLPSPPKLPRFSIKLHKPKFKPPLRLKLRLKLRLRLRLRLRLPKLRKRILLPLSFFFLLFTFFFFLWLWLLRDLPKPGELTTRSQKVSSKIYDRNGNLLFKVFRDQNRTLVKLDDVPLFARQATIAIEDAEFYSHPGFSLRGMSRAILYNFTRGELTGGSTITQQLVKNALLTPEKTFTRKIKEIILAIQVELSFSKDQILEMYLNEVSYGGAAYGIEEASQLYFGKSTKDLTLAQGALLAGLPRAPTTYSPFGANPSLSRARQLEVLSRMVQEGYINSVEADKAMQEKLVFAPQRTDIKAPHFVMYIKQLLAQNYGENIVDEGGLEVVTSLDLGLQEKVEEIVRSEIEKIKGLRISNGAALVINPKTGEILAMAGSKDYFNRQIDGNFNVTTALRQPGSSIKPVNYSYALESGRYTAASIIDDSPITYWIPGSEPYSPKNYDSRFHGRVPLRTALGSSYNVPAVKVLASYGVDKMLEQGKKLGITTWNDPHRFGLSLTLGGGEVKMVDMAVAYGVLANYGKRVDLHPILKVTDYRGKVLEEDGCEASKVTKLPRATVYAEEAAQAQDCGRQVLDPRVAFILTDILRDNTARTPAFGPGSLLVIPNHTEVAVKTGTTQNLRDNWAIGYTKDYVALTWVGNNDNTPMLYVASGVTGATPIWNKIMRELLEGQQNHSWEIPSGIKEADICPYTGTLPCEGCSGKKEYFLEGTEPMKACVPKPPEENPEQLPEAKNTQL